MRRFYQLVVVILITVLFQFIVTAQSVIDSNNYQIIDANLTTEGSISDSSFYSLISNTGDYINDFRFDSTSYTIKNGSPNGMIASVPKINCFETDTNNLTTTCTNSNITSNGMIGVCGAPGCYDRAKLEIDTESNPPDTLYLVKITDLSTNQVYYLNNSNSLDSTIDFADFLDICALEGANNNNPDCDESTDLRWDADLQKFNILGLKPDTSYSVEVSALSGDFTGTGFSSSYTTSTHNISISFDLDISAIDEETSSPNAINFGVVPISSVFTSEKKIWIDLSTNDIEGIGLYIKDEFNGLYSANNNTTLNSETEDLSVDTNSNGGFGVKVSSLSTSSLGPLQANSHYQPSNENSVGNISTNQQLLLFTNNSSTNTGILTSGRASLQLKLKTNANIGSGNFHDTITFLCLSNI